LYSCEKKYGTGDHLPESGNRTLLRPKYRNSPCLIDRETQAGIHYRVGITQEKIRSEKMRIRCAALKIILFTIVEAG